MNSRTTPGLVRVLLVDDQQLFREGIARLLARDHRLSVVGQAEDGEEAISKAAALLPDVVLMDVNMPRLDGIHATARILAKHPSIRVLMLAAEQSDELVVECLRAGAVGYVIKDTDAESLRGAVLRAAQGGAVLDRKGQRAAVAAAVGTAESMTPSRSGLTRRQQQILRLMVRGLGLKQIGRELGMAEKTVRNQASQMYAKLHVSDRVQAILYGIHKGLTA
ncbi:MAG TPA: response regulator transcription factor [Candidatus Dormibacteraeota bacterium]|nr:response regulator transcription factor [Candidatus Dormibacteraeota bacterium]